MKQDKCCQTYTRTHACARTYTQTLPPSLTQKRTNKHDREWECGLEWESEFCWKSSFATLQGCVHTRRRICSAIRPGVAWGGVGKGALPLCVARRLHTQSVYAVRMFIPPSKPERAVSVRVRVRVLKYTHTSYVHTHEYMHEYTHPQNKTTDILLYNCACVCVCVCVCGYIFLFF
jgi:hypothetical protein